ncbi:MAG: ZIP family metal transporter [Bacteroidales bacterium]|nr:ZIP family metal transporter [Bacteroidales bacterium]MCM1147849.1 ZIP family metal transporter [Bacteroidales bacterium]MCM1206692.1 ZIP family metal transporter [Bacillota bacterium]MCM1510887.1 ZIP family metal transporter [Clostridium sp.]
MNGLALGLIIPVIGTTLGAALVYTLKDTIPPLTKKLIMGFTAGVMIAASVWSLLIPAMSMTGGEGIRRIMPAVIGFIAGTAFLLMMDYIIPHRHGNDSSDEGPASNMSRTWKLVLAIILHNIPEGMAIGVAFAAVMEGNAWLSVTGALALSIGIAIQNIPEGAIVSLPLCDAGNTKNKAFTIGFLSGVVQPAAALLTIWLASVIVPLMPYLLAFAAGAMLYVVVEELIPASAEGRHSNLGPTGFAIGFLLMIILDAALN